MYHRALLLTSLILALAAVALARNRSSEGNASERPWLCERLWFIALGVYGFRLIFELSSGGGLTTVDDFNRVGYAMEWSQRPFFAQADHLWLTGSHAILGSLIFLFRDPLVATTIWSALSWSILALGMFAMGRCAQINSSIVAVAVALLVLLPVSKPLLVTGLPDVLHTGLILLAVGSMTAVFTRGAGLTWSCLQSSACLTLATTLRFESWLLVPVYMVALVVLVRRIGGESKVIALGLIPFLFPALWMASSLRNFGDSLAFSRPPLSPLFHHYTFGGELRQNPLAVNTPGGRVMDVWFMLKTGAWVLLPFFVLVAGLARREFRILRIVLPVTGGWVLLLAVIAFRSGVAGHSPERLFLLPLAVLLSAIVHYMILLRRTWAAVVILLSLATYATLLHQRYGGRPFENMDASAVAAGQLLRREFGNSAVYLEHVDEHEPVFLWASLDRARQGELHAIAAHSGDPRRIRMIWKDDLPEEILRDPGTRLLVTAGLSKKVIDVEEWRLLETNGSWELRARESLLMYQTDDSLVSGGTVAEPTLVNESAGLEWAVEASSSSMTWIEADEFTARLEYAGYEDWRMPTRDELWLLRDTGRLNEPSMDARFYPAHRYVWSQEEESFRSAWRMDLTREWLAPVSKDTIGGIRPVRILEVN